MIATRAPMALTPWPSLFQLPLHSSSPSSHLFYSQHPHSPTPIALRISDVSAVKLSVPVSSPRANCFRSATEEDRSSEPEAVSDDDDRGLVDDKTASTTSGASLGVTTSFSGDSLSLGIREPVYEVCCKPISY